MMLPRVFLSVALACLLCAASSSVASAQQPYPACDGFGYINGFGVSGSLYGLGHVPVPPYFSLHPPVYYSLPVPRTYGYSPFPYSGNTPTPEVAPEPLEVMNPHVKPDDKKPAEKKPAQKTANKITLAPQTIINPFVELAGPAAVQPASANIGN